MNLAKNLNKIEEFLSVFKHCAAADTAYDADYNPEEYGKLHSHCGCVSYALKQLVGGDIIAGYCAGRAQLLESVR